MAGLPTVDPDASGGPPPGYNLFEGSGWGQDSGAKIDVRPLVTGQKTIINKLDDIRGILASIKLDSRMIVKNLQFLNNVTSGEEALEGLKDPEEEDQNSSNRGPRRPMNLAKSLSRAIKSSLGKVFDWGKWFALIGLAALYKDQIIEFIIGAFPPIRYPFC